VRIRIARSIDEGRQLLRAGRSLDTLSAPPSLAARIEATFGERLTPMQVVERIVQAVRDEGDVGLERFCRLIDGQFPSPLRVDPREMVAARERIPPELAGALETAAQRILEFHRGSVRRSWFETSPEGVFGQIVRPLERVGLYVPGGRAAYPSSLLMSALPAKAAGVREVIVATPPGPDGRVPDVVLAAAGLIISFPLWLLIAAAIKAEDGGPLFYGQERVGRGGRIFRAYKFRSMIPDAEEGRGPVQAAYDDPRATRVGRILRATALDELPQLWSILVGDMSFVGPRALRPREIEVDGEGKAVPLESIPGYQERLRVRPGLTGIAQVYAPRNLPRRHKFRYDLLYIRKQSFWLDLKLILASFWITARGKWESEEDKL